MSPQVTEAHRELARTIRLHLTLGQAYQLIADSEALACAELRAELATCKDASESLIESLRAEVERLKKYSANLENDVKYLTQGVPEGDPLFLAVARAERAEAEVIALKAQRGQSDYYAAALSTEAELANIRALANRRNKSDHSQDTTHQLVAALDQALDIAQAELATERAKYNQLLSALVYADQILDDIDTCSDAHKPMYSSYSQNVFKLCIKGRDARRASIDAAMKEGA